MMKSHQKKPNNEITNSSLENLNEPDSQQQEQEQITARDDKSEATEIPTTQKKNTHSHNDDIDNDYTNDQNFNITKKVFTEDPENTDNVEQNRPEDSNIGDNTIGDNTCLSTTKILAKGYGEESPESPEENLNNKAAISIVRKSSKPVLNGSSNKDSIKGQILKPDSSSKKNGVKNVSNKNDWNKSKNTHSMRKTSPTMKKSPTKSREINKIECNIYSPERPNGTQVVNKITCRTFLKSNEKVPATNRSIDKFNRSVQANNNNKPISFSPKKSRDQSLNKKISEKLEIRKLASQASVKLNLNDFFYVDDLFWDLSKLTPTSPKNFQGEEQLKNYLERMIGF